MIVYVVAEGRTERFVASRLLAFCGHTLGAVFSPPPTFLLCFAVPEIESWLLADRKCVDYTPLVRVTTGRSHNRSHLRQ